MEIHIGGKAYQLHIDYRNHDALREQLNRLTQAVYGFDFEEWHQAGYWGNRYIPYSLADGDKIVSNVSISIIDFLMLGSKRTYVQIGTVMTDPSYRKLGLNRVLLEKVLEDWRGKCDLIYLFANNSVLDFYPKFGFYRAEEYRHSKAIDPTQRQVAVQKLNMSLENDRSLVIGKIQQAFPVGKISMLGNSSLAMFYLTSFMSETVYYLPDHDAVVIAGYEGSELHLHDIFCEQELPIEEVLANMAQAGTEKAILGFTPNDSSGFLEEKYAPDDVLFILDDRHKTFGNHPKVRFPMLSHA